MADLCEQFLTDYAPGRIERGRMAPRTLEDYRQQIRRYILPGLGHIKAGDLKRPDVERAIRGLRPVMRNRVLALVSRLMTYAETCWNCGPSTQTPAGTLSAQRSKRVIGY